MSKRKKSSGERREVNKKRRALGAARPRTVRVPCEFDHVYGSDVLRRWGPLVFASWRVPPEIEAAIRAAGEEPPPPVPGALLLDTGAHSTCISLAAAEALNLKPIRMAKGFGAHGEGQLQVFFATTEIQMVGDGVSFSFGYKTEAQGIPDLHRMSDGLSYAGKPLQLIGLLGRDVLRFTRFVYHGTRGSLHLEFNYQAMGLPEYQEVVPRAAPAPVAADDSPAPEG